MRLVSFYHVSYFSKREQTLQVPYFSLDYRSIILQRTMFRLLIHSSDSEAFLMQARRRNVTEVPCELTQCYIPVPWLGAAETNNL